MSAMEEMIPQGAPEFTFKGYLYRRADMVHPQQEVFEWKFGKEHGNIVLAPGDKVELTYTLPKVVPGLSVVFKRG